VSDRLAALSDHPDFRLTLACMLADQPPPAAANSCRALRCSNDERDTVHWLLTQLHALYQPNHLELTDRLDLADLKQLLADERFHLLCDLLRARLSADNLPLDAHNRMLERCRTIDPAEISPPPLITGDDLIARRVEKGPVYARLIDALYRAQLNNQIHTRDQALARLDDMLVKNPPHSSPEKP